MKSLSLAALQISIVAFLDVVHCQDIQQLRYLLRGRPAFGDQSGLELWPRQYGYESRNALGANSDASPSYGGRRYGILPVITPDYTGRTDGVENFGNSDNVPYGGIKRISRRKTILIVIRRRRPRSQGSEDDGRWGRQEEDYSSDDQSTNDRRRAGRALLRILLRKLLLAATRRSFEGEGSDESQGRDFRSEQPWGRSERGWRSGWRFGEGGDSGRTDSYDGRGSRWGRDGLDTEGGRILVRVSRPHEEDNSGFYVVGSGRVPQSGSRWNPSEYIGGTSGGIPGSSSEESGPMSDISSSGAGHGVVRNMGSISTGGQPNPHTGFSSFLSGTMAGSRGFGGSIESFTAQPSTRPHTGLSSFLSGRLAGSRGFGGSSESFTEEPSTRPGINSFEESPNQAGHGNEETAYGGMGRNYYPGVYPRLIIRLPQPFTPSGPAGSPGGNYGGTFGGAPDTTVSDSSNNGYSTSFEGIPAGYPMGPSVVSGPDSVNNAAGGGTPSVNSESSQKS
uniref:Rhipicephalus family xi n=1 Tax=Rhipicephalus zambeziensis TaxID=60191 RepID=A0A224YNJ6_9ACAR